MVELGGVNVAVTPAGNPLKPNVTVPVKPGPGLTVIGTVVAVPAVSVKVSPGAETLKLGPLMTSVMEVKAVLLPEVPAMFMV